jgi:hypothetical protein
MLPNDNTASRQAFVTNARAQHGEFWEKWRAFRCTDEGDDVGHAFWHVITLIDRHMDRNGTVGLFAKFMDLAPNTLVVDIAAGSRPTMLKALLRNSSELNGYVVLELPEMEPIVKAHFRDAGHEALMEFVPCDFWHEFPGERIQAIARQRKAEHIVTMTYWGATYLPELEIRNWVSSAIGISERVYINMLSHGKFNPDVLRRQFTPYVLKLMLARNAEMREVLRAFASLPKMVRFGKEFSRMMPLWAAEEIQKMLVDIACIGRVRTDTSMNQTTFVELLPF